MLFGIYQDIKNLALKNPESILSLMALILGLFLPGLLQLCINEREMFLLLDLFVQRLLLPLAQEAL